MIREIKEELSYQLKVYHLFKKYRLKSYHNVNIEYYVYLAPLSSLSELKQLEGDNMSLFTIEDAKKLKMVKGDDLILKDLQEII